MSNKYEFTGEVKTVREFADHIMRTRTGVGMTPPFYAETASVKGNLDWPFWIVRNKTCNSLGELLPRPLAEQLAVEMNKIANAALTQSVEDTSHD